MRRQLKAIALLLVFQAAVHAQSIYVLIGWNDLGMHCDNKDFSTIAILPPYNNIYAQLIKRTPGQAPQVITSGFTVEYSVPYNTYSVGKTNFWTYAQQLFGLSAPLPPNIGLTGKGLTGTLDPSGNYFYARGIPLTPYADTNLTQESPYQLVHLVAKDSITGTIVATTDCTIPVSNDMSCVQSGCHTSYQQIISNHDDANLTAPVLCANCHADNALGTTGKGEAPPFSEAIHSAHAGLNLPNTIGTCYNCHPGKTTKCLRGAMVDQAPPDTSMICEDCHGSIANVAETIKQGRRPWLDEPSCATCHGSNYAPNTGKLFKDSQGHGNLFCEACHGSTHGLYPTRIANDNVQSIRLQGSAGIISKCSVCHGDNPTSGGPHGMLANGGSVPGTPVVSITSPLNGTSFNANSNITITASASDSGGTISSVSFYQGGALLGVDSTSPYSFTWNDVPAGSYSLTAIATNKSGATTISSAVNISVIVATGISSPIVSIISPPNGATFYAGSNITLKASASEEGGTISRVDFYAGTAFIGSDSTSPYSVTWHSVRAGDYTLTAVATDATGVKSTSSQVNIVVKSREGEDLEAQNYPNPFNPSTEISYKLANAGFVKVQVYNTLGEVIQTLVNEYQDAGAHTVSFNGNGLSSGTYFYSVEATGERTFKKMILLR